jgi:gluconate 5-dehydrogenase
MALSAFSLAGKIIFVTGSSRGLGWTMAQACAKAGATTILHGRSEQALKKRCEELNAQGLKSDRLCFDVEDRAALEKAIPTIHERHGAIWGLINNVGCIRHAHLFDAEVEDYEFLLNIHLLAPMILTKAAARLMQKNEGNDKGRILNIGSIAVTSPRAGIGNYTAAKNAVIGFTRSMSADLGEYGIRCNAISPGYFLTDLTRELQDDREFWTRIEQRTPARRWGDPGELGGPAVFLMSEASSYVSGQNLYVDGGMSHTL